MAATLSPEFQITTILDGIGCAPSNFSDIVGRCSNSRVMAALKGTNDFNREDAQYYLDFARQLKKLSEDYPVPIAWKETQKIREILTARRAAVRPVPFSVIFVGPALFKEIVSGRVETTGSYQDCAAFANPSVAMAAAKLLDAMGEHGIRTTTITNEIRGPGTVYEKLSDFGFAQ
jgi:hypothetical protein